MKIIWDPKARASLRQIAHYINTKFGRKARLNFMQRVKDTEKLMKHSPEIGQIDPLFANRPITYRSVIINGLNKLVYYVEDNIIYIADFWDTRMEPIERSNQVK